MRARKPSGGYTSARVPRNAHEMLAQGQFNRTYLRGLSQKAIQDGRMIEVYRAKPVRQPRPDSEALIGEQLDPRSLLNDLRTCARITQLAL